MSILPRAQARYWLCCGSQDEAHRDRSCMQAKTGHPEHCRFGTAAEHSEWQLARRTKACATCSGTGWFHFTGPGGGEGTCPDCHGTAKREEGLTMPQRTPSPEEWNRVIRSIENAQHLLLALPREPQLDASILAQVEELKDAARLLGYEHGVDPFPQ